MESLIVFLNSYYIPVLIIILGSSMLSLIISKRFLSHEKPVILAKRLLRISIILVFVLIAMYVVLATYYLVEGVVNALS